MRLVLVEMNKLMQGNNLRYSSIMLYSNTHDEPRDEYVRNYSIIWLGCRPFFYGFC